MSPIINLGEDIIDFVLMFSLIDKICFLWNLGS